MADNQTSKSNVIGYSILFLVLLTMCGGAYLLYNEWKKQKAETMPAVPGGASTAVTAASVIDKVVDQVKEAVHVIATPKNTFPMAQGSKGDEVKNLQRYLNVHWQAGLQEDGIWGSKTSQALQHFEKTSSVSGAEYTKLKHWLDTFPHDLAETIHGHDVVINQNTQSPDLA